MKSPTPKKVGEDIISRHDVEQIIAIVRARNERLERLRSAYLEGDPTPLSESDVVREAVGLPKARIE